MCGITGAINVPNAYNTIIPMMKALQYRGENGAGIAMIKYSGEVFHDRTELTVSDLIRKIGHYGLARDSQSYHLGIGSVRYGTAGDRRSLDNTQPFVFETAWGMGYLAHNGGSPYMEEDRKKFIDRGFVFQTTSDTELILANMGLAQSDDPIACIKHGLRLYRGTYAVVMLIKHKDNIFLVAARDQFGNRPLALGRLGGGYVVASEDSAFEVINAEYMRDILPGEILIISQDGLVSDRIYEKEGVLPLKQCVYELEYFSLPTSKTFGISVSKFRKTLGGFLAKDFGHLIMPEDVITNVPDSSNSFAEGFCRAMNRNLTTTMLRRHFSGRSFTKENQVVIDDTLREKFSFDRAAIEDILKQNPETRFWLIEDSIVRGNTGRKIIRVLRGFGIRWIGILSGVPPLMGPCKKGIDMEGKEGKLIAVKHLIHGNSTDPRAIAAEIEANFVGYQTMQSVINALRSFGEDPDNFCFGCFENRDPIWNKW